MSVPIIRVSINVSVRRVKRMILMSDDVQNLNDSFSIKLNLPGIKYGNTVEECMNDYIKGCIRYSGMDMLRLAIRENNVDYIRHNIDECIIEDLLNTGLMVFLANLRDIMSS